jgi:hypothetical protein
MLAIATKRNLAKASIDPGVLNVMGMDRGDNAMNNFM